MTKTLHFKTNINCDDCLEKISEHLDQLPEIYKWEVNTNDPKKILTVTGENISSGKIIRAVKSAGYKIQNADSVFSAINSFFYKKHDENCCQ